MQMTTKIGDPCLEPSSKSPGHWVHPVLGLCISAKDVPFVVHIIRILPHNPASGLVHLSSASRLTLLLADTDSPSSSASGLGVLASDSETPVVSETTVGSDLLQSFQILTKLALHAVCQNLRVLAVDDIALSVQKP